MLRITQNVTQKRVSNLKDAFHIFTELLNILSKNHFSCSLTLLWKNCLFNKPELHHFQTSSQYNFTTKQSILDMTV